MAVKGDTVKWERARKNLGIVVTMFLHREQRYVVVEKPNRDLVVCLDCEQLVVTLKGNKGNTDADN